MNPDFLHLGVDALLAEELVQDYLRGDQRNPVWQAARQAHPDFDARLLEAEAVLKQLSELKTEQPSPAEETLLAEVWAKIERDTQSQTASPVSTIKAKARVLEMRKTEPQSRNRRIYAWAAAIAASILLLFFLQSPDQQWSTEPGETELVYLSDSTEIWLSPASQLEVKSYDDQRVVELEGEGFFNVVKGKSFTVITSEGRIQVLGTSFRVDASGQALHVRCQSGRVAVERAKSRVELGRGESTRSEGEALSAIRKDDPATEPAPNAPIIVGRETTVAELSARLGRYYALSVQVDPALANRRLTIELPTNDLAEAVRRLEFVLQVRINTSGGRLHVGAK